MMIKINGLAIKVKTEITLHDILEQQINQEGNFSCAVNTFFIPKSEYKSYQLSPNDEVEIVMAMQGG